MPSATAIGPEMSRGKFLDLGTLNTSSLWILLLGWKELEHVVHCDPGHNLESMQQIHLQHKNYNNSGAVAEVENQAREIDQNFAK